MFPPLAVGRVQVGTGTDPRHRNLRSGPAPATPLHRRNGAGGTARPETAVSPNRNPRLRLPRWQQGASCHDPSASSPLDDFLRQTSVAAGPGTRTLRRYRHDLGLEVRNDRYSVLRSRGGVRGEGADAQLKTPPIFSLPPRSHGASQSGGRRLGRCLSPNCSVIYGHTQATPLAAFVCDQSSYFKQASTESNALVSVAVTQ